MFALPLFFRPSETGEVGISMPRLLRFSKSAGRPGAALGFELVDAPVTKTTSVQLPIRK